MAFDFSVVTDIWQTLFWPAVLLLSALYLVRGSLRLDTQNTDVSVESSSMDGEVCWPYLTARVDTEVR